MAGNVLVDSEAHCSRAGHQAKQRDTSLTNDSMKCLPGMKHFACFPMPAAQQHLQNPCRAALKLALAALMRACSFALSQGLPVQLYRFAQMEGRAHSLSGLDRRVCALFFQWSVWSVFLVLFRLPGWQSVHSPVFLFAT